MYIYDLLQTTEALLIFKCPSGLDLYLHLFKFIDLFNDLLASLIQLL